MQGTARMGVLWLVFGSARATIHGYARQVLRSISRPGIPAAGGEPLINNGSSRVDFSW